MHLNTSEEGCAGFTRLSKGYMAQKGQERLFQKLHDEKEQSNDNSMLLTTSIL